MRDYEETALKSIESMKEAHQNELKELWENLKKDYLIGNRPVNKHVLDFKAKEKAFKSVKKYHKAEVMRWKW